MAHRPAASSVTKSPDTLHVVAVVEAKLTARPDEAVAETVNAGVSIGTGLGSGLNVMVCANGVIVKL